MLSKLVGKKEQFCLKFVGEAGCNGAKAARLIGLSPARAKVSASEYLRDPAVRERIRGLLEHCGASGEVVVSNLTEYATADAGDLFDEDGNFSFHRAFELGLTRLIKSIEYHSTFTDQAGNLSGGGIKRIELVDALKANELLGRTHKLFVDRFEYDYSRLSDEELIEAAKGIVGGDETPGADDQAGGGEAA